MRKTIFTFLFVLAASVGMSWATPTADLSKNIAIDLRSQQLGGDGSTGGSKYLIIDSENNYTYVDDEPAAYNAYFQFQNFNGTQHGYTNLVVTVPVQAGNYLLTLGGCQYGTGTGNVKSATNETLASFDQKTAACFSGNPAQNSVSLIFTVAAAQNITINCGNWTPYFAIKKMAAVPTFTDFEINFQSNPCTGKPDNVDIAGTYHDNLHGYQNVVATVPVKAGNYRLTVGACQYGSAGSVISETNEELTSFDPNLGEGKCYHNNTAENIIVADFTVDIDQNITINGGNYTPYMKLERIKEIPAFTDFAIDLRSGQLGGDGETGGSKYLTIAGAVYSYVDAEPDAYNAYFVFANFNGSQHGYTNLLATVPMKAGDYRLTLGTCQYGTGTGNVKSASDATLASFNQNTGVCYHSKTDENIIVVDFTVAEDQLITIDCGNYTPYIALDKYVAPATEDITTNQDPENQGCYYSTFFHSTQNYALTNDGTQAFVADLSGSDLVLTKIAEGTDVIPANTAVILRKTGSSDPVALDPTDEPGVSISANNDLQGVDVATTLASLSIDPDNCYVLSGTAEHGVGFYKISGSSLKANKAYVIYDGEPSGAPRRMRFVFDQTTGVENAQATAKSEKLIENGQLVIIKSGVKYNAQGMIVK